MSAISSLFSPPNLYQADRNDLALSAEAVGRANQASAESDEKSPHEDRRGNDDDSGAASSESEDRNTTAASATDDHRFGLNVTA